MAHSSRAKNELAASRIVGPLELADFGLQLLSLGAARPHLRFGLLRGLRAAPRPAVGQRPFVALAADRALAIGAGHSFLVALRGGFPVSVLNAFKLVPEVCTIFCATANRVEVVVATTGRGRGIVGMINGDPPLGIETDADATARHRLLRQIGYKL